MPDQRRRERRRLWAYGGLLLGVVLGFALVHVAVDTLQHQADGLHATQRELKVTTERLGVAVVELRADERRVAEVNRRGTHGSCLQLNKIRNGLVGFVSDTLTRARLNRRVVYGNPNSTVAQRAMADFNIAAIDADLKDLRTRLVPQVCP